MTRSKFLMIPLNYKNEHWHLLIVLTVRDDSKQTEALFFDVKLSAYDPIIRAHIKLVTMTNCYVAN